IVSLLRCVSRLSFVERYLRFKNLSLACFEAEFDERNDLTSAFSGTHITYRVLPWVAPVRVEGWIGFVARHFHQILECVAHLCLSNPVHEGVKSFAVLTIFGVTFDHSLYDRGNVFRRHCPDGETVGPSIVRQLSTQHDLKMWNTSATDVTA